METRAQTGRTVLDSTADLDWLSVPVVNQEQSDTWRSLPADFRVPQPGLEVGATLFKIEVNADGMYRITYEDLLAAGMDVAHTNPFSLSLNSQGMPVAIELFGDGDSQFEAAEGFIFYGQSFRGTLMEEKYTDVNVYWLDPQDPSPLWMSEVGAAPGGDPVVTDYRATVHLEQDLLWNAGRTIALGDLDTWYWDRAAISFFTPIVTKTQGVALDYPAPGPNTAIVRAELFSECKYYCVAEPHHAQMLWNGILLDEQGQDGSWVNIQPRLLEGSVDQAAVLDGANQLSWVLRGDVVGISTYLVYLNWIEVSYQRLLVAVDDELTFGGDLAGSWTYQVSGFDNNGIGVWNVTDPRAPVRLAGIVSSGSGPYGLAFGASHADGARFTAVGEAQMSAPLSIEPYVPPDLDPAGGADWIAISHPTFLAEAQRLADLRAIQGLRTTVVNVEDLYNLYSHGIRLPGGIRDFLAHALEWPGEAPFYVVLVGDGNWNYPQSPNYAIEPDLIPPFLGFLDPYQGEVPADNLYVTLVGDDAIPDMALGRLPVNTVAEATVVVNKIIAHEQQLIDPADWQFNVVLLADDPDEGGNFDLQSEEIAGLLPAYLDPARLYYNASFTGTFPSAVTDLFNSGATLFNYRGHGSLSYWGSLPILFDVNAIPSLTNIHRLPVVLTMDCLDAYFAFPGSQAISEQLLRYANGGSVGHWGSSGLGLSSDHSVLHRAFYQHLFNDGYNRLGMLTVAAKQDFAMLGFEQHNLQTFTLLADPAMPLMVNDVSVDKQTVGAGPFRPGEEVSFRLAVNNRGLYWGQQAVITDIIPAELVSTTVQWSGLQITPTDGITYRWSLAPIEPYANGVITVSGRVDPALDVTAGLLVTNTAEISAWGLDWNVGNNSDAEALPLGRPVLSLAVSAPQSVVAGFPLTFTLDVTNTGSAWATNGLLVDQLPEHLIFSWASDAYSFDGATVSWPLPPLASGTHIRRQLVARVDRNYVGTLTNMVYSVSADYALSASGPPILTGYLGGYSVDLPLVLR